MGSNRRLFDNSFTNTHGELNLCQALLCVWNSMMNSQKNSCLRGAYFNVQKMEIGVTSK